MARRRSAAVCLSAAVRIVIMLAGGGSLSEGAGNGGKKAAAERFFDQGGADFPLALSPPAKAVVSRSIDVPDPARPSKNSHSVRRCPVCAIRD